MQSGQIEKNKNTNRKILRENSPGGSHVPSTPKKRATELGLSRWELVHDFQPTNQPTNQGGEIRDLPFSMQKNPAVGGKFEKKSANGLFRCSRVSLQVVQLHVLSYELPHGHGWVDALAWFDAALREFVCQQILDFQWGQN